MTSGESTMVEFLKSYWEVIAAVITTLIAGGAAFGFVVHGSRRDSKAWYRQLTKSGSSEWVCLALVRKPETLFVEGWAKSEWGKVFTRMRSEVHEGVVYHFRVHCVEIAAAHIIWSSVLKMGDEDTYRDSKIVEGVTIITDGEVYRLVEKPDEVVLAQKVPVPLPNNSPPFEPLQNTA